MLQKEWYVGERVITRDSNEAVVSNFPGGYARQGVYPAAMNFGDHKSPFAWSYSTLRQQLPHFYVAHLNANGTLYRTYTGCDSNPPYDGNAINIPTTPGINDAYNKALSRLNEKVRGSLDISIDLAEAHQTKRMLNAYAQLDNLSREIFGKSRYRTLKALSSRWLEYQYGWRPLIGTIYDSYNELRRRATNIISDVQGTATLRETSAANGEGYVFGAIFPLERQVRTVRGVKFHCKYQMPDSIGAASRWSSLNPVSIAWELMPYSFVIDWFVDIGGYIRNFETALLNRHTGFVSGYYTQLSVDEVREFYPATRALRSYASSYRMINAASAQYKKVDFRRVVLSAQPFPMAPSFQCSLGWQRSLSAAALLANFLPRR